MNELVKILRKTKMNFSNKNQYSNFFGTIQSLFLLCIEGVSATAQTRYLNKYENKIMKQNNKQQNKNKKENL